MASENSIVLKIPEPNGDPLWATATPQLKIRYFNHAADQARILKLRRLRQGRDVEGGRLYPVLPKSRPDGATGPPLSPHQPRSRTQKLLRSTVNRGNGTVTLWWSHGWGQILGYHREGIRRRDMPEGIVQRNVIGLEEKDERAWIFECGRFWRLIRTQGAPPGKAHEERVPGPAVHPPIHVPRPAPVAARAVYLPSGIRPRRISPNIQIYER